ncbi:MAG: hypothetical protein WA777_15710 [Rhodanobacter sp.]
MTDMTLEQALSLADQDSPMPHLAGQALKVLRDQLEEAHRAVFGLLLAVALHDKKDKAVFGRWSVGVDFGAGDYSAILVYTDENLEIHVLASKDC